MKFKEKGCVYQCRRCPIFFPTLPEPYQSTDKISNYLLHTLILSAHLITINLTLVRRIAKQIIQTFSLKIYSLTPIILQLKAFRFL